MNQTTDVTAEANVPAIQSAIPADELARLSDDIVSALKTVYDPEIPADIYELGLVYKIDIEDDRQVKIDMTLTAPGCPVAGEMPGWVENAVGAVEGGLIASAAELRDGARNGIVEASVQGAKVIGTDGGILFHGQLGNRLADIAVVVHHLRHREPLEQEIVPV